jgi:hypothetical protein
MAYESVDMDGHRRMLVADHRVRDRASADQERRYRAPDLRFRDLLWNLDTETVLRCRQHQFLAGDFDNLCAALA